MLFLFKLRNVKCKSTVEIVMRNESNVLNCNGNMLGLVVVNIVEITFVNWYLQEALQNGGVGVDTTP